MNSYAQSADRPDAPAADPLICDLVAASRLRTIDHLRDGLEHELRSPLNAIVLNVELLKELVRAEGGASAVVQLERLQSIERSLTRLQDGLGELLRLTAEPNEARVRFDLNALVEDVAALVGAQLKQQGLRLDLQSPETAMPVKGRREALREALVQVVINAMQASSAAARIEIASRREGSSLVVDVRDDGPGIEPESQERIFERHYSTRPGQAGLGLYVARQLIEADGGELRLTSTGPEGTVVSARFPEDQP